ncbi:MAG TPA: putative DNA-binding domain-containing protein [Pseudomonadota bacterium]|nr:putative DNA-binding domain-containing protein [Pseudomonadota bacterium]
MKLADFFAQMEPFLLGKASHAATVEQLYGASPPQPDADRLAIYGRFCDVHRHEVLDGIFPYLRTIVVRLHGESGWDTLVRGYFDAHPMHHFELNHNAVALPSFLGSLDASSLGIALPDYAAALADFEWWEWQTLSVEETADDLLPDGGPLRLHGSVELRPYPYDLLSWIEAADDLSCAEPPSPEKIDSLVLFWRDRTQSLRRDRVSSVEIQIIKAVYEEHRLDAALAEAMSIPIEQLAETALDLYQAGIVIGDAKLLPSTSS